MPKPILSDSLFNADDVATAIIQKANLQIANSSLAVIDRSDKLTATGGTNISNLSMYEFMGFMFISFSASHEGTPGTTETLATLAVGSKPLVTTAFPGNSHQGDNVEYIRFETSGDIKYYYPENVSSTTFFSAINGVYRINI